MPESKGSKEQLLEKLSGKVSSAVNSGSNQLWGKNSDITEEKINTSEEQKTEVNDLPDEAAHYAGILEKYFSEDGYQLGRAIFRGRFRNYYSTEYGHEPEQTDEQLEELLCEAGTQRDGRVFPKNGGQDALVDDIMSAVNSAFESGATVVYPAAVFERYRGQLAGELHIYTEEALNSLILDNSGRRALP